MLFYPFPNDKILDLSKLKEFADDNFQFDENDIKFSKKIANTVGKGEIALLTSNFSISHSVFQRLVLQIRKNLVQERVKCCNRKPLTNRARVEI